MKKYTFKNILPITGSTAIFLIFFLYGFINNLSVLYNGSTSYTRDYVINHSLLNVIFFMLKLLALYIIAGIIFGLISSFIVTTIFCKILKKKLPLKIKILINAIITFTLYLPFILKDFIFYPQVYINGFYVKNRFNMELINSMTDNINPVFFTSIQILFAAIIIILAIYRIYRFIKNRSFKKSLLIKATVPVAITIIIISFFILRKDAPYNKSTESPNILILASDALRPDHLSGYGYFRNTSPNMDRLLDDGISFMDMRAEVPGTFPSWLSILTGQYASTHGIRHMFPASMDLNKNFVALPGILSVKGYFTSVVADYAGDIFPRINLGFKNIDAPLYNTDRIIYQAILDSHIFLMPFLTGETGLKLFPVLKDSAYFCPPDLLTKRIIKSINKSGGKPFFITAFFSSTNYPYSQSFPFYKLFSTKNYRGPYKFLMPQIMSFDNNKAQEKMSDDDKNQAIALYDGGIKAFDNAVGIITEFLEKKDILRNTIIIILSDHGENLYEADLGIGHGEHFRGQYSTRIPFIISNENLPKKNIRITNVVRPVDIAPTILDMLKIENPAQMEGISLLPLIEGKSDPKLYAFGETDIWYNNNQNSGLFFQKQRIIYPEITDLGLVDFHFNNSIVLNDYYRDLINLAKHRYIYDGKYKLIYIPLKDRVIYELYDTENDPEEKTDIALKDKTNFNRLKDELFKWFQRNNDVIIKDEFIFPKIRY